MSIVNYCQTCINYLGDSKCNAFNKIPLEIIRGTKTHEKPIDGQKGKFIYKKVE